MFGVIRPDQTKLLNRNSQIGFPFSQSSLGPLGSLRSATHHALLQYLMQAVKRLRRLSRESKEHAEETLRRLSRESKEHAEVLADRCADALAEAISDLVAEALAGHEDATRRELMLAPANLNDQYTTSSPRESTATRV